MTQIRMDWCPHHTAWGRGNATEAAVLCNFPHLISPSHSDLCEAGRVQVLWLKKPGHSLSWVTWAVNGSLGIQTLPQTIPSQLCK